MTPTHRPISSLLILLFFAEATVINVPGMGDSITNGTIVTWQKSA
jgi:hypothetical protein